MGVESPVQVYIYDLTQGLARTMSLPLLGKQIDGVWHTGIVAYGKEFFFGGSGIESCAPGGTIMGRPNDIKELGNTEIPYDLFIEQLRELSQTTFRNSDYHLLRRNCNNFSSEIAQFLTGKDIPSYITGLPDEVLSTPFGQMILPMLESMSVNPGVGINPVFGESAPSHRVAVADGDNHAHAHGSSLKAASSFQIEPIAFNSKQEVTVEELLSNGQQHRTTITELLEYLGTSNPSWGVSPTHCDALGVLLSNVEDSSKHRMFWIIYQQLFTRTDAVEAFKRCQNNAYFEKISIKDPECVKSICNLCSSSTGYILLLARCRHVLENLCSELAADGDIELLDAVLSTASNVSLHHKVSDDLDITYTCSLVEMLNSQHDLSTSSIEKALGALYNFMSNNEQMRALAVTMGLDVSKFKKFSANVPNLSRLIDFMEKL